MAHDYPFHRRESDTVPFDFGGRNCTMEGGEQVFSLCRVETDSIVPDETGLFPPPLHRSELDNRRLTVTGIFPGIPQQVPHDDLQETFISPDHDIFFDAEYHAPVRLRHLEVKRGLADKCGPIDLAARHLPAGDKREV